MMFDTSIICRSSRWVAQVTPSISPISNPTYICPNLFHSLSEAVQCIVQCMVQGEVPCMLQCVVRRLM